jgi:nucleoside-diphosphate-sugar epimerase
MTDGTELWHELEASADSREQPCAITDSEGRPWIQQPVDARDVVHGCICALENDAAIGEVFNISAPHPIPFDQAAKIVADETGKELFEWQVPVRWVFDLDNTKARCWINYRPKWGIREMVDSALSAQ